MNLEMASENRIAQDLDPPSLDRSGLTAAPVSREGLSQGEDRGGAQIFGGGANLEPLYGLHAQPSSSKPSDSYHPIRQFIRNKMPLVAYSISALWHLITAGVLKYSNFSKETKKAWTNNATRFTKLVNSLVYSDLAAEAWQNKFSFDFLGRVAEPIMNIFVDLNHYHLFRGFSSAFNQLHTINLPRVAKSETKRKNFLDNIDASIEFFQEIWTGKGKGWSKMLFGGEHDKGHTLALASHLQLVVGALALLNGTRRNLLNRILGVVRNVGGVIADIGLLFEKDYSGRRVGQFYIAHAIGDTIKRFVSDDKQDIIDNLIMPFYAGGLYYFGLMGRRQADGEYVSHEVEPRAAAATV